MKNTRGISSIIATLILILLTIVLIGVVWMVVSGIVKSSSEGATSGAKCLSSSVEVTSATCTKAGTNCNVTVQRTTGTDNITGGVRLVFINAAQQSNVADVSSVGLQTLASVTAANVNIGVANVTEVDATIYFADAAGVKSACSGATTFNTVALV